MRIEVNTHNGGRYETEVESYDPIKLNEDLNNTEINTIVIGGIVVSRIQLKLICPIDEELPEEIPEEVPEELPAEPTESEEPEKNPEE